MVFWDVSSDPGSHGLVPQIQEVGFVQASRKHILLLKFWVPQIPMGIVSYRTQVLLKYIVWLKQLDSEMIETNVEK